MSGGGHRDVEQDLRVRLGGDARAYVRMVRQQTTTVDAALNLLVQRSFGSPERLRDAADLLGDEHSEARALLVRAVRRAEDPPPPEPPRPSAPPDAPRPLPAP